MRWFNDCRDFLADGQVRFLNLKRPLPDNIFRICETHFPTLFYLVVGVCYIHAGSKSVFTIWRNVDVSFFVLFVSCCICVCVFKFYLCLTFCNQTALSPIIDEMIVILSAIQSGTLERLSFYRSTTEFARYLKASGNFTSIVFTGHSLGGGLAIISGARAEVQAVAISGPNALLSRKRFGVTPENLERFTFNVLPDRDAVAMIDDPVKNIQKIQCTASPSKVGACHQVTRSLCEILFTCGSGPRPVIW